MKSVKSLTWSSDELDRPAPVVEPPPGVHTLIQIRELHKRFLHRHVLRGVSLDIHRGEILFIIGGSGSGKTTLFRHLMGLLRPDDGRIRASVRSGTIDLGKADDDLLEEYRSDLGVVFQNAALLASLTVLENVGLPLIEVDRLEAPIVRQRVIDALTKVYLPAEEILHLKPANLSGGMRKRVGVARAIVRTPSLILYDEPTTGLDPVTVTGVNDLIVDLNRRYHVTSVVISHDLDAAFRLGHRIAMLYKGRIIACGSPDEIRANPHPVLRQMVTGSTDGPLTDAALRGHAKA